MPNSRYNNQENADTLERSDERARQAMAFHPGNHQHEQRVTPLRRRPRERLAGGLFQAFTRVAGFRPGLLPEHMRRQLRIIGIRDEQLDRVLPTLRTLADWPYAWEAEGDARAAERDWSSAFAAYYVAQRILLASSPLKDRLYSLAVDAYARVDQPQLERIEARNAAGERIVGYLQLPEAAEHGGRVPCVLIAPGITGTKEELHSFAMPFLRRGVAVARIDNPAYGETEGVLTQTSVVNARHVLDELANDPRLDPDSLHLYGMSLGANFLTEAALDSRAATLSLICPPFQPSRYFDRLPTLNVVALQHSTGLYDLDALRAFVASNDRVATVPKLTQSIRLFHGGRDSTVPVEDAHLFVASLNAPSALTIYERDHHNCLEHLDEISAHVLEFVADPEATCALAATTRSIDEAATIHPSDEDAIAARAGSIPRRRLARLPFLLPGVRPRVSD